LLKQAALAEGLPISALVARIRWRDWAPACAGVTVEGFAQRREGRKGFSVAAGTRNSQVAFDGVMEWKAVRTANTSPSRLLLLCAFA
jgi:hypothetical protein